MAHDVHGTWTIVQGNGFSVVVDISQRTEPPLNLLIDGPLSGTADSFNSAGTATAIKRPLNGEIIQDSVEFSVDWGNGTHGQYSGNFDPQGNLTGVTFDVAHPTSQATWFRRRP